MTEEPFRAPTEADWSRASDVLAWLHQVTRVIDVERVSDLLDRTMRALDDG